MSETRDVALSALERANQSIYSAIGVLNGMQAVSFNSGVRDAHVAQLSQEMNSFENSLRGASEKLAKINTRVSELEEDVRIYMK